MSVDPALFVWITLMPGRLEFCREWARRRRDSAVARNRAARNGAPLDYDEALAYDERGVIGEAATMIYLSGAGIPMTWHFFKDEQNLRGVPDIDDWIDVKTARMNHHRLAVQKNSNPKWAYVLARAELLPRICLVGWCFGDVAMHEDYWGDPAHIGAPAYWIGDRDPPLRPMLELRDEFRRRGILNGKVVS